MFSFEFAIVCLGVTSGEEREGDKGGRKLSQMENKESEAIHLSYPIFYIVDFKLLLFPTVRDLFYYASFHLPGISAPVLKLEV